MSICAYCHKVVSKSEIVCPHCGCFTEEFSQVIGEDNNDIKRKLSALRSNYNAIISKNEYAKKTKKEDSNSTICILFIILSVVPGIVMFPFSLISLICCIIQLKSEAAYYSEEVQKLYTNKLADYKLEIARCEEMIENNETVKSGISKKTGDKIFNYVDGNYILVDPDILTARKEAYECNENRSESKNKESSMRKSPKEESKIFDYVDGNYILVDPDILRARRAAYGRNDDENKEGTKL